MQTWGIFGWGSKVDPAACKKSCLRLTGSCPFGCVYHFPSCQKECRVIVVNGRALYGCSDKCRGRCSAKCFLHYDICYKNCDCGGGDGTLKVEHVGGGVLRCKE